MDNIYKFDGKANNYHKYRPKYSNEAINYLIKKSKLKNTSQVVDIGCGTGILTKQLLEHNINTIGVEPNIDMYNKAKQNLKNYKTKIINASAENTTLPSNYIDLITVAQALHWFKLEKFIYEYQRILKNSGRVAILYNNLDKTNEAATAFFDTHKLLCPKYSEVSKEINLYEDIYTNMFGKDNFQITTYENNQLLNYEEYIGYSKSLSYSLNKEDLNYNTYMKILNNIFYKYNNDGILFFPTTTTLILSKEKKYLKKYTI